MASGLPTVTLVLQYIYRYVFWYLRVIALSSTVDYGIGLGIQEKYVSHTWHVNCP